MRDAVRRELRNLRRYLDANWLLARLLVSYLWLYLLYRLRGPERIAARMERTHERNAQRVLDGILRLKAVYIKLGQVLSVLGGVFPPVFTEKLAGLQDAVPPTRTRTWSAVSARSSGRRPRSWACA